jgi:hypothetical protein
MLQSVASLAYVHLHLLLQGFRSLIRISSLYRYEFFGRSQAVTKFRFQCKKLRIEAEAIRL